MLVLMRQIIFWILWPFIWLYAPIRLRVRAVILYKNQLVVVKNKFGAGRWQLPGGGIKTGENAKVASIREVKEELAIDLSQSQIKLLGGPRVVTQTGLTMRYQYVLIELLIKPKLLAKNDIYDAKFVDINQDIDCLKEVEVGVALVKNAKI